MLRRAFRAPAAAAAILFALPAATAPAQEIGGVYAVKGTNFDGSTYRGKATISLTDSTNCRIVWETGGATSVGICMRNLDAFSAAYALGHSFGLVVYHIQPDGSLEGVWSTADQSGAGTETLTPQRAQP
jgi:hypothetical protein